MFIIVLNDLLLLLTFLHRFLLAEIKAFICNEILSFIRNHLRIDRFRCGCFHCYVQLFNLLTVFDGTAIVVSYRWILVILVRLSRSLFPLGLSDIRSQFLLTDPFCAISTVLSRFLSLCTYTCLWRFRSGSVIRGLNRIVIVGNGRILFLAFLSIRLLVALLLLAFDTLHTFLLICLQYFKRRRLFFL